MLALTVAFSTGACGIGTQPAGQPSGPSGSLGVVTQAPADRVIATLCSMLAASPERGALTDAFENRAHEELHVIAAATQERERVAAGAMLLAKERVEADLAERSLPGDWHDDLVALLRRTQDALVAIGLRAESCPADQGFQPGSGA